MSHRVRLAVLPFTIVGDEPGQEYFADGLTEEMMDPRFRPIRSDSRYRRLVELLGL